MEKRGNIVVSQVEYYRKEKRSYFVHTDDWQLFYDGQKFQEWENEVCMYSIEQAEKIADVLREIL